MPFTTLIQPPELVPLLGNQSLAVVDCRFSLNDTSWGEAEYEASHVPGAVYAHLDRDLSGVKTGHNGRHPLPAPEALADTFGRLGIDDRVQVVAYDQDNGMCASRLWWLLRWMGHAAVAVLDGGFTRWLADGGPVRNGRESRPARSFRGAANAGMLVNAPEIQAALGRPDWKLLDARAPDRFRGENETLDRAAGRIPGAANHFYKRNVDDRGVFRAPDQIRAEIRGAIGDTPPEHVVSYCGSGVTACHNLLAFEHAGLTGAKLYPGSWSEWSSDPSRPIEAG